MELEVTWTRAIRIWWAYLWRSMVAIFCSMIIGAIVGGMIGVIMGIIGASQDSIVLLVSPISLMIGLAVSIVPIKMILGKDFGEFRLVLIQQDPKL